MWLRAVLCVSVCAAVVASDDVRVSRVVKTKSGAVRGYQNPDTGVFEFRSIPYATAPTGPHKFRAPLPPPIWFDTLEAVDKNIMCPQAVLPGFRVDNTADENCLLASVYVPDTKETNLPVVVYVHGGAFQIGHGDMMVPTPLIADHNIIVVTFNYRLGVHGFLCLGTDEVPGNAGMKDQVALLKWVKNNIASFGGNADDVTIHGSSAGSASVDLLMLSKAAEGLFNRVIPESGANIAAFTIQSDPLENAKWFAKSLNFTNVDDVYALEEFYRALPLDLLTSDVFASRPDSTFVFSPCIERAETAAGSNVFLRESPVDILKKGNYMQVPLFYGFAKMEGLLRIGFFDIWKDKMNEQFSEFLPADLKFDNDEEKESVAKTIKEFYFGDKPVSEDNVLSYVDYFTDVIFAYPMLRAVKMAVENGHNQIYLYEYSFVDENTPVVPHTNIQGANHCAQTAAVFGGMLTPEYAVPPTEEFKKMSATVGKLWANFIKTGTPVPAGSPLPSWPPVSRDWSPHMSVSQEGLQLKGSLLARRTRFWDDIYSKHYRDPIPPPTPPARHTEL